MLLSILRICLLSLLSSLTFAQFQFLQPDGNLADRSQSFSVGSTLDIQWKAGWSGILTKQVYVDLFLTDFDANSYVNLIAKNISLEKADSLPWKINVPDDSAAAYKTFVLRFVKAINPPNYADGAKVGMSPSRGFNITVASPVASSSSRTSSTATKSTLSKSTLSATPTPSASSTQSTQSTPEKASTPVGAIVGGVLGGLALVALGIISFLLLKLVKRRKAKATDQQNIQEGGIPTPGYYHEPPKYPQSTIPRYEDVPVAQELHATEIRHEADAGYPKRPGQ